MSTQQPIEALQIVADCLTSLGIEFYIGGSIASTFYGQPRATIDVDIVADVGSHQVQRLEQMLSAEFYADASMMHDAIVRKASFNLIHMPTSYKIDVFIPKKRPFDNSVISRTIHAIAFEDDNRKYNFASAEDTILSKLEWYREGGETSQRQLRDVIGVMKVQYKKLDLKYMRKWASELNVSELLEQAWAETNKFMDESI